MREATAQKNKITGFKIFYGASDISQSAAFAYPHEFNFMMVVPKEMDFGLVIASGHEAVRTGVGQGNEAGFPANYRL